MKTTIIGELERKYIQNIAKGAKPLGKQEGIGKEVRKKIEELKKQQDEVNSECIIIQ